MGLNMSPLSHPLIKKGIVKMNTMIRKLMLKLWKSEKFVALTFKLIYPIARIFQPPQKLVTPFLKEGQVVADIGCATGFYTTAIAELVGSEGKVYAVDINKKSIQALEKKIMQGGYSNVEPHVSSAADLSFIKDGTIDFVFASGLL